MYLNVFVTELSGTVRCWAAHGDAVTPRGLRLVSPESTVASGRRDIAKALGTPDPSAGLRLRRAFLLGGEVLVRPVRAGARR